MAGKLIITKGLPASGKSTWALHYATRSENYDTTRIVTMDDIRKILDARFPDDEGVTKLVRDVAINEYLRREYTVISADTNLAPKTLNRLILLAEAAHSAWEIQDFTHVPLGTCLERNAARWARGDTKVPDQAIVNMHERYLANA